MICHDLRVWVTSRRSRPPQERVSKFGARLNSASTSQILRCARVGTGWGPGYNAHRALAGLGQGLGFCISEKLPGDTCAAGAARSHLFLNNLLSSSYELGRTPHSEWDSEATAEMHSPLSCAQDGGTEMRVDGAVKPCAGQHDGMSSSSSCVQRTSGVWERPSGEAEWLLCSNRRP